MATKISHKVQEYRAPPPYLGNIPKKHFLELPLYCASFETSLYLEALKTVLKLYRYVHASWRTVLQNLYFPLDFNMVEQHSLTLKQNAPLNSAQMFTNTKWPWGQDGFIPITYFPTFFSHSDQQCWTKRFIILPLGLPFLRFISRNS